MSSVTTKIEHAGHTLEIITDMIDITPMSEPDPRWRFTDSSGHNHRAVLAPDGYGGETVIYPTLTRRHGPEECGEEGDPYRPVWQECPWCGERITPGSRMGHPRMIKGATLYLIDGRYVDERVARDMASAWQRDVDRRNEKSREGYL